MIGTGALVAAVPLAVATVVAARWRRGGPGRRLAVAVPLGAAAGLAEAVALAGNGRPFWWWLPVAGAAVAAIAVTTLTRGRRHRPVPRPAAAAAPPLGRWRPEEVFASSEVATVYRAVSASGQPALVKVVAPHRAGEPAAWLRLDREARLLAELSHPNVVRLREAVAGDPGPPVLIFDDVDGAPLSRVAAGALSGPSAVTLMLEVLAALAAVHHRGLVHRAVAPHHIWLDRSGRVLLAGFELACAGIEHPLAPEADGWASPEQRAGRVLDARADLWSCALILRELLGSPAPAPLGGLVAAVLADDPARRPGSAGVFASELRRAAEQSYGVDWAGRGALAAALSAHGAIGAAAAGWALGAGGAATAAGAAGLGAAGAAGLGAAGAAGLGAAGAAGLGGAGAVGSGAAGPGNAGSGAASAGAGAAGGPGVPAGNPAASAGGPAASAGGTSAAGTKAGTAVTAATACAAAAVMLLLPVIADADRASPEAAEPPPAVDPDQARDIAVAAVTDALAAGDPRLPAASQPGAGELSETVVGVPCDPAAGNGWFVASGQITAGAEPVGVFLRLVQQDGAGGEWSIAALTWSTGPSLPGPAIDGRGCLAPVPDPAELLLDPADVPAAYERQLVTNFERAARVEQLAVTPRSDTVHVSVHNRVRWFGAMAGREEASAAFTARAGPADPYLVPLDDGTVMVTFPAELAATAYNAPGLAAGPCSRPTDQFPLHDHLNFYFVTVTTAEGEWIGESRGSSRGPEPPLDDDPYRQVQESYQVRVAAWVPRADQTGAAVVVDDFDFDRSVETVPC